jgi:hypothetical protein
MRQIPDCDEVARTRNYVPTLQELTRPVRGARWAIFSVQELDRGAAIFRRLRWPAILNDEAKPEAKA